MSSANSTPSHIKKDTQLKTLEPKKDRNEVAGEGCRGLRIRILPTGKKNFVWYARSQGKRHIVAIGTYPDMSLADAGKKLGDLKEQRKEGSLFGDGEAKVPKTIKELAEMFYKDNIQVNLTEGSAAQAPMALDKYLIPPIGQKKLAIITPLQVGSVVQHIVKKCYPSRAETVLSLLTQMFLFAIGRGFITHSPAYALKKKPCGAKTEAGERVLNEEDIHAFWSALDEAPRAPAPVRTGLRILLLSGVRSGQLRLAPWKDVDFINNEWSIPAENSKTIAWKLPLSSHIIKHLRKLEEYADDSPYVIAGKNGAVADKAFHRAMTRLFEIKDKEGKNILTIEQASPHDLRRTMRSKMDDLDIEPHISEKCLNHSLGKIEKTCNNNPLLKQRRIALEKWGDYIDLLVMPRENVTMLSA